jgi:hypothetical protein
MFNLISIKPLFGYFQILLMRAKGTKYLKIWYNIFRRNLILDLCHCLCSIIN